MTKLHANHFVTSLFWFSLLRNAFQTEKETDSSCLIPLHLQQHLVSGTMFWANTLSMAVQNRDWKVAVWKKSPCKDYSLNISLLNLILLLLLNFEPGIHFNKNMGKSSGLIFQKNCLKEQSITTQYMHEESKDCNLINLTQLRASPSPDQHIQASLFPMTVEDKCCYWSSVK